MFNFPVLDFNEFFLLLLLAVPISVILHEFGHAIPAALLTKKEVQIFIGSFGDKTKSFKISAGLLKVWFKYNPLSWSKGLCKPTASSISYNNQMVYVATGPFAPFLVATIGCFEVSTLDIKGLVDAFFHIFFYQALGTFVLSLIPIDKPIKTTNNRTIRNDGYALRKLYKLKKYNAQYKDAIKFFNEKDYQKAGESVNFLLSKKMYYEDIYRFSIVTFIKLKNYDRALNIATWFKNSLTLGSDDYCNTGLAALYKKDYVLAKIDFEKSLQLNPDNAYTLNNIGYYYTVAGEFEKAIPCLDKALILKPDFSYAYNNRGLAKIKTGNVAEGLNDINKAIELDNTNSYVYRNLGIYHMDKGEFEEAIRLFNKAYDMDADTDMIDELKREAENGLIKQKSAY